MLGKEAKRMKKIRILSEVNLIVLSIIALIVAISQGNRGSAFIAAAVTLVWMILVIRDYKAWRARGWV